MPLIELHTIIDSDIKTCFDLARNIDFHKESLQHSNEKAIAGKTSGLIGLDEWVTWEAKHFSITQKLTSKITEFDSPNYFVDEQVSGAFKSFKHEHIFLKLNNQTLMIDKFHYQSPYGIFGRIANILFLKKYMTDLLKTRNEILSQSAKEINNHSL